MWHKFMRFIHWAYLAAHLVFSVMILTVVTLAVRARSSSEKLVYTNVPNEFGIVTTRTGLVLQFRFVTEPRFRRYNGYRYYKIKPMETSLEANGVGTTRFWNGLGWYLFVREASSLQVAPRVSISYPREWRFQVPYWFMLLSLGVPIVRLGLRIQRKYLTTSGHCTRCGYDLCNTRNVPRVWRVNGKLYEGNTEF